jgi:hypothetical protein
LPAKRYCRSRIMPRHPTASCSRRVANISSLSSLGSCCSSVTASSRRMTCGIRREGDQ